MQRDENRRTQSTADVGSSLGEKAFCFSRGERFGNGTKVAYLFPTFPVLHQTFVLWEVLALRARGIPIQLYSLKRPAADEEQQPEAIPLKAGVTYLPSALHPRVWWSNAIVFARSPRRYVAVMADLVGEWWADRQRLPRERVTESVTWRELLQGFYNTNPVLYLLKSLVLAWESVDLGRMLVGGGVRHVHAHWASYPATVAYVIHRLYGIHFSFTAHAYDIYMMQYLLREKLRAARFVVTCAATNAEYLAERFGADRHKLIVNYHGTDLQRFSHRPSPVVGPVPLLLSCGRLERYKGMHVLLRACAQLAEQGLIFECAIVGEGPQRRSLEALAAHLGIADRVRFHGVVSQAQLAEMMAWTTAFVLASVVMRRYGKQDVIPNVLVEAMASRVPVVASDVGGVRELVRDRHSGRLVRPGRPDALATAIADLLRNPEERDRLAAEGQRHVRRYFDREVNIAVLADLMRAAAGDQRSKVEEVLVRHTANEPFAAAMG
jgi:colanic acid/amylovoran biosynthesis glycosyltransferase